MESSKNGPDIMTRIATFIVNKRNAFIALFIVACVYCLCSISKVEVDNELTDYLKDTTETRQGLTIMDDEFTTFGTAKFMVTNITYENALVLRDTLENITGISAVEFYDRDDEDYDDKELTDYYKDASALYTLTFEEPEETEVSQKAIAKAREAAADYECWVYTTVDKDDAKSLQEDMNAILAVVAVIILLVLLFTSGTYMEILIFLIVFVVAAILNMGTNYLFGTVSFVTNAVATVLQLALAIDYAIIFFHRFMEEHEDKPAEEAVTIALSKAIVEISSSSLTTISGMVAMMFMQFEIGMDMGRVLSKAIVFSMVTVFLLMPALILMFSKAIDRTRHKSFVPSIRFWGQFVLKLRALLPIFLVLVAFAAVFSNKSSYIYDVNSIVAERTNEYLAAKRRISQTFPVTNQMAVVIPKGDYDKEGEIIRKLEAIEKIDTVTGLANVEVDKDRGFILVDELTPLEFSQVADVDLDLVRVLFRYYELEYDQYGQFLKSVDDCKISVIDLIDFMYDQKEKGALDFDDDMSEDIDDLHEAICDARDQLEGENYSRIVFTFTGAVEGDEAFALVDQVRDIAHQYYEEAYVVGDATSDYELSDSFTSDNVMISVLSALFVGIILLFTFQSAGLPFMLLLTIQGSIWINFAIPYLTNTSMYFLSYLVVSAIQMGATIDYAIVITNRYTELRKLMNKKEAIITALDQSFATIVTSGTILTSAGFVVGKMTSNAVIASLGMALGRGALISIILVMSVLPLILYTFDKVIDWTQLFKGSLFKEKDEADEAEEGREEKKKERITKRIVGKITDRGKSGGRGSSDEAADEASGSSEETPDEIVCTADDEDAAAKINASEKQSQGEGKEAPDHE